MTLDEAFVLVLKRNWREAPIDEIDRAILTFAEKLTLAPSRMTRKDTEELRAGAKLDDRGVLQVTGIAAFFNYFSRVADALGVGKGSG
ncbi:MAG: carboxymuconolactone decarboxylase family protein [Polyangia bacterium]